jgi:glycosyltransferase involved in cell wall biosynthesis
MMEERKTKVMHIIQHLSDGGVQKMFVATVCGLQRRGTTENTGCVVFDCPKPQEHPPPNANFINLGLPLINSYPIMGLMMLYEFPLLLWTIIRVDPDVIYVYFSPPDQLLVSIAGKILGKKVIIRKYGQEHGQHIIYKFFDRLAYPLCEGIVSLFKEGKDELMSVGVPHSKISYIPNGKQLRNPQNVLKKGEAKSRLSLKSTDFVIGMVSRLHPMKNQIAVLEALPELLTVRKNIKFVVVGDSPLAGYKKRVRQLIRKKGLEHEVVFLGGRKDINEILPAFDIFVHPSKTDALPGAVLEAMCFGLPIVASNVGGTKDLLTGCGIMVPPDDVEGLTQSLKKLMKDPKLRQEYGKKARLKVQKEFSLETMLDRYEKLFKTF